jgi:hypothetical protein
MKRRPGQRRRKSTRPADISVWSVANAPQAVKNAFTSPLPSDASIVKLSVKVAKDIALEATLLAHAQQRLIARVELNHGEVVLLIAP